MSVASEIAQSRFLIKAPPEADLLHGLALERDPGETWVTRHIRCGDSFVTRSRTPYEVSFRPPVGEELENISMPEHGGDVPAIALTAFARLEDRRRAVLSGFQMHMSKPVEPSELIAIVSSLGTRSR